MSDQQSPEEDESEPCAPRVHGDGRGGNGRFTAGNKFGGPNHLAGRAAKIRAVLLEKLTPEAAGRIADKLIAMAEGGDLPATRELLDRTCGKAIAGDVAERLDAIEATIAEGKAQNGIH